MATDSERAEWARQHRVAYELAPLVEMHEGRKVHVGYTLSLYAAVPMDLPAGEPRQAAMRALFGELKEFAQSLKPQGDSPARVEVDRPRPAAYLRPENDMKPEVALTARIVHSKDYFAPVTTDERARLGSFEQRLTALGLKRGHW